MPLAAPDVVDGGRAQVVPRGGEARCDQFNLEFANREFAQIELLADMPAQSKVGVGVIDVKSYFVETAVEMIPWKNFIVRAFTCCEPINAHTSSGKNFFG